MQNTTCRCCGESLEGSIAYDPTLCDECEDNQSAIARGEFHDPDLIARDREELQFQTR